VARRVTLSQQVFYLGLSVMLLAGIAMAAPKPQVRDAALMLTGAGALLALAGRLWQWAIRRRCRSCPDIPELGGYPLDMIRDPGFLARR